MKILSKQQKQTIRAEFYQKWKTCSEEMVKRPPNSTVTSTRQPVLFVLRQVIQELGLWDKIDYKPHRDVHTLVKELDLKCATCGRKLGVYSEVGKYSEEQQLWQSLRQNLNFQTLQLEICVTNSRPRTTQRNYRQASGVFAQSAVLPQISRSSERLKPFPTTWSKNESPRIRETSSDYTKEENLKTAKYPEKSAQLLQPQPIFLTHAHSDSEKVLKIYKLLLQKGYQPCFNSRKIFKPLEHSNILITCLSKTSLNKPGYLPRELQLAFHEYGKRPSGAIYLIPLKLDNCPAPDFPLPELGVNLRDLQWINYWKRNGVENLIKAIKFFMIKYCQRWAA